MSESVNQEDVLDLWRSQIRQTAERTRAAASRLSPECPDFAIPPFNWPQLSITLTGIAPHAQVGTEMPPIRRYRGPFRYGAALVAKVVLYVSKFLTTRQREYNVALLEFVRELGEGVRNLELRVIRQAERIRELEAALAQTRPESRKAS